MSTQDVGKVPDKAVERFRAAFEASGGPKHLGYAIRQALHVDLREQYEREIRERLQSLTPHEVHCRCDQGGDIFDWRQHREDCPRREVTEMLDAALSSRSPVEGEGRCDGSGDEQYERETRERLAERLEEVDDGLVVLRARHEQEGKWDSVAYLEGRQHECRNQAAALRGIHPADGQWVTERAERHRALLDAALSSRSPVEREEAA